jgi:CBS domain-containing protein
VKSSEAAKFTKDKLRRQKHHHLGGEVGQDLVLVKPTTTLMEVLEKMVKNRIHRIYVIDPSNKPVGVVTCSDILRKVLETILQ